ncbi:hypothetical protein AVEN_102929-1 [Araneus ventricosus]|uniref:Uncharacterized protein n=1 Tax=Araneus ventricosus TaxID=182803 RepID=A0A4Y2MLI3_ARAVE|nr:hypothetical protein AVEN_102929-1 [Araneus ventricosus]
MTRLILEYSTGTNNSIELFFNRLVQDSRSEGIRIKDSDDEINGSILVPRLGWETSLFPPVNDKCDSRTRFSNRLESLSVEKRTPISRQLCTWRKRYSLARSVVSISELTKFSFKMEAAKT